MLSGFRPPSILSLPHSTKERRNRTSIHKDSVEELKGIEKGNENKQNKK